MEHMFVSDQLTLLIQYTDLAVFSYTVGFTEFSLKVKKKKNHIYCNNFIVAILP